MDAWKPREKTPERMVQLKDILKFCGKFTTAWRGPASTGPLREAWGSPSTFSSAEKIRSHFGALEIDGIKVEIMGDIQKFVDGRWEAPADLAMIKRTVEVEDMKIPVLSPEYEYQAYLKMGRLEKAKKIKEWLDGNN
jgi:hypothetical protein